ELLCREVSLALAEDDPSRARAAWARAGEFADALAGAEARARVAELEARVLLAEGDPSGAAGALDRASRVRGRPDLGNPYVRRLTEELRERLGADGVDRLPGTGPHPPM
ncbi:MAG TPA: AfsR/SARP family transcriptional regulator, partial [Nocardiopsis listeri]|nr:AfsR/SARP family transcriptional regulator [Nocardiopsis listeri]